MKRISQPQVSTLKDGDVAQFRQSDDIVIIAQISAYDLHLHDAVSSISDKHRGRASFGTVNSDGPSSVLCYNNKDDEQISAADMTRIEALAALMRACMKPLIGAFTHRTEPSLLGVSSIFHPGLEKVHC